MRKSNKGKTEEIETPLQQKGDNFDEQLSKEIGAVTEVEVPAATEIKVHVPAATEVKFPAEVKVPVTAATEV